MIPWFCESDKSESLLWEISWDELLSLLDYALAFHVKPYFSSITAKSDFVQNMWDHTTFKIGVAMKHESCLAFLWCLPKVGSTICFREKIRKTQLLTTRK